MSAPVHSDLSQIDPPATDLLVIDHDRHRTDLTVEIVVPVHNEEGDLAASVRRLDSYLRSQFPYGYVITVADNASTDRTWEIAQQLAAESTRVRAMLLARKGRGLALKA